MSIAKPTIISNTKLLSKDIIDTVVAKINEFDKNIT